MRIELTRQGTVALVLGRSFCPERKAARSLLLLIRIGLTAPPSTLSARRRLLQRSGDNRTRTDDPLRAKQVLSQLSYAPKWPVCSIPTLQGGPNLIPSVRDPMPLFFAKGYAIPDYYPSRLGLRLSPLNAETPLKDYGNGTPLRFTFAARLQGSSAGPTETLSRGREMAPATGLEPMTPRLTAGRSNQLSYAGK